MSGVGMYEPRPVLLQRRKPPASLPGGGVMSPLPPGRIARVRGVQVHGAAAPVASAGQRTALNLAGVEPGDVVRGMVQALKAAK